MYQPRWLNSGLQKSTTKFPSNSATKQVGDFGTFPSRDSAVFLVTDASLVCNLVHTGSFVDDELALGMCAVAVEDDRNTPSASSTHPRVITPRSFPTRGLPTTIFVECPLIRFW